ncbi:MAG: hypothetical protein IGS03_11935 [Candidatus Sericytochromatia bacterium]|nr:hypothetical protein [Candidatus Sericytochromatia bacterium]
MQPTQPTPISRNSRRLLCSLLLASLSFSACTQFDAQVPATPAGPTQQQRAQPVLAAALLKRTLQLQRVNGQVLPVAAVTPTSVVGFAVKQVATAIAIAEPAMVRPAIAPAYYYGGHDFNQYSIQYAEENIYPGASGTLLSVYEGTVKGILQEWDADARLVESRAQLNVQDDEYIHLPGRENDKPMRIRPDFVFRFASTPRKETLNIYVMGKETRVHRMVWGEPSIQIDQVRVDSDRAVSIAQQAFASRNNNPGYPVYPRAEDIQNDRNMEVVYEIPADLQWHVQLNQQSRDQLRYFLHFNFVREQPLPVPGAPSVSPDAGQDDERAVSNSSEPMIKPMPPEMYQEHLHGSIEIDAVTGEIKNMNRPVLYRPIYDGGVAPGFPGVPMPMPVDPVMMEPSVSSPKAAQ